jgi:hypothetical protein
MKGKGNGRDLGKWIHSNYLWLRESDDDREKEEWNEENE